MIVLCSSMCLASQIYDAANTQAKKISEINPEHEYVIQTQDWVEVTDKTTGETGWAKLSEIKKTLSSNSQTPGQWSYRSVHTSSTDSESMHYKPFSAEEIKKQALRIEAIHQHHQQIMNNFSTMWSGFDELFTDEINTEHHKESIA